MSLRLGITGLTALGLACPTAAIPPPLPPPVYYYYGPVRLCEPGESPFYSVDVLEGEAGMAQANQLGVNQEHGAFGIDHVPGPGISMILPDAAEPIVRLEIPNAGPTQRVRMPDGRIRYRIEPNADRYADRIEIQATAFDGTDRDLEILRRIRFGEEARTACASVAATYAATPDRRDELAFWLSPKRHRGPLTLCWHGLALDVRANEFALLSWRRDFAMAIIEDGVQQVAVTTGLHPAGSPLAWTGFSGAVADDPRFAAELWEPAPFGSNVLLPRPAALRVRVMTRADRERYGPDGGAHVTFSFAQVPADADRAAFVRRLREQTSHDHCFDPDRQ
jgi:hypothetical protein